MARTPDSTPTYGAEDPRAQTPLDATRAYHERTKHHPSRFAASLGYLDWKTQPEPFLRFAGSRNFQLTLEPIGPLPKYEPALMLGQAHSASVNAASVSRLFYDSLALSAWKHSAGARWALRVNPSSGNLHPTEGYLVGGPFAGLHGVPGVYHYAPRAHELELRAELSPDSWRAISRQLPPGAFLVGLTTIGWREAWKYGERAFRYCNHDVGHAIACVSIAAAGLGWDARLLEGVTDEALSALVGIHLQDGPEAEHPDCLIAIFPQSAPPVLDMQKQFRLEADHVADLRAARWQGRRNALSADHHPWPAIDAVVAATEKRAPPVNTFWSVNPPGNTSDDTPAPALDSRLSLRKLIHQRRSAVAFDGRTGITAEAFYQVLLRTMPGASRIPFTALPWRPRVDLLLFVHRVQSLPPGLYALVRDPARKETLKNSMDAAFAWEQPEGCPPSLGLFFLEGGDARHLAKQTSCGQAIASDGVFAVAMLTEFREPLEAFGPWFYRRLYWETGLVGQVLYLEAEASGIRATGIGCFLDDVSHRVFGLKDDRFQVLYQFTMGSPVEDSRLETLPPYEHLEPGRRARTPR